MIPRTLEEMLAELRGRVGRLERRLVVKVAAAAPYVLPSQYNQIGRGTTAERTTLYPAPATAADQAALANLKVWWFNTDTGWPESYYATTGTAGLTAVGLVAGAAAGWYPVGAGPAISLIAGTQQSLTTGNTYTGWNGPGFGRSWRRGGAAYFTYAASGAITAVRAGRYRVLCVGTVQQGTGSLLMYLLRGPAAADPNLAAQAVATLGTWDVSFQLPMMNAALTAGETLRLYAGSVGSAIFMQGADGQRERVGMFTVEYIGPALVTD